VRLFKISLYIACLAAPVVVGISCSDSAPLAGWGSETTNGVAACVVHTDGSPAVGAIVRLRRSDYLTPAGTLAKPAKFEANASTDAQGRFEITGIDSGAFNIEIYDDRSALLFTCSLKGHDTMNFGIDTLRPYAAISGTIDSVAGPAYAQVFGLERLVPVGSDGQYRITDLPQGDIAIRIISPGAPVRPMEISHIKTFAGQTTAVSSSVNWPWSRRLYLNTTMAGVAADVDNFPLLVRLDSSNFDFMQTNGSSPSFLFVKEDQSPLPHAIESLNKQAKTAVIWVALDTIYGNSMVQYITMSWNDSAQSLPAGTKVFDTAQGYCGVWHLDEAGSGATGEFNDATVYGSNGTGGNGVAAQAPARVAGVVGSAQMFDGGNDFVQAPDHQSLDFADQMTASFWIYYDSLQPYNARIISKDMDWDVKISSGHPQISIGGAYYSTEASFQMNAWNHVAVTISGLSEVAVPTIYLNGRPGAAFENTFPDSFNTANRDFSGDLFFGQLGDNAFFLHGALDEIWLQRNTRSAAWVALLFENQRPGSGLVEFLR
jgi:hypothetical protein